MIGTKEEDTCRVTLKSSATMNTKHVLLLSEGRVTAMEKHISLTGGK